MPTKYIYYWQTWKELCEQNDVDPYENVDVSVDEEGGDSRSYEYVGEMPKEEE